MRNRKIVVAIPHSHGWFWVQTCIASLKRNPPVANGFDVKIIVVDNSPWSPAIKGIRCTQLAADLPLYVIPNTKSNKFHASALDTVVEKYDFDFLMAMETDVMVLRPTWLQWFLDQMQATDFAVGMWHHERFINPSCTIYRGDVLRRMQRWCWNGAPQDKLRWGVGFNESAPLDSNLPLSENPAAIISDIKSWVAGPFAEKRGWPTGTILMEQPSGQMKGPGWYEPGQQLHHWAVEEGWTYTICPTSTTEVNGVPVQTMYGPVVPEDVKRQLEANELFGRAEAVHLWGGTRALDIIKHPVTCEFVKKNTPIWLAREARFWRDTVPLDVRITTLDLIRKDGWHITGQGTDHVTDRDREAAKYVKECYESGGVTW